MIQSDGKVFFSLSLTHKLVLYFSKLGSRWYGLSEDMVVMLGGMGMETGLDDDTVLKIDAIATSTVVACFILSDNQEKKHGGQWIDVQV